MSAPREEGATRRATIAVWGFYEELFQRGYLFTHADAPVGEDLLLPFNRLHGAGRERGVEFVSLDLAGDLSAVDGFLFLDHPREESPLVRRALESDRPRFLATFESPIVRPESWSEENHRRYDKIFTWHDPLVDGRRYFKINYAHDLPFALPPDGARRERLCAMIAGNKRSASASSLYGERLKAIRWFEAHRPGDLDLYGKGWTRAEFPSYRGEVASKRAVLARYRFSLCYENVRDVAGYVTEKIFDCLLAGCVPVYRGADDIAEHVPRDCFVDLREFRSYEELHAFLAGMSDQRHARYQESIARFLGGPESEPFSIRRFCDVLVGECLATVEARRPPPAPRAEVAGPAWEPRVSICIPTFNRADFLRQAVDSALGQDYRQLEVVIGDNASTDGTREACRAYARDPRVRYYRSATNRGATANVRSCVRDYASGEYALVLSDDDLLVDPSYVSKAIAVLRRHRDAGMLMVFCDYAAYHEPRQAFVMRSRFGAPEAMRGVDLLDRWGMPLWIPFLTGLFHRRTALDLGAFEDDVMAGDTMLWWKLCLAGDVGFVDSLAAVYRVHGQNDSVSASLRRHLNNLWMFVVPARLAVEAGYELAWVRRWKLRMAACFLGVVLVPAVRQAIADSRVMDELGALYRAALATEMPADEERAREDAILERAVAALRAIAAAPPAAPEPTRIEP